MAFKMNAKFGLVAVAAALFSSQITAAVTLHELADTPAGWSVAGTPSDDASIVLQVALKQQNIDQLEPKLQAISSPGSASYGKYLDIEQTNALFGASKESSDAVTSWLTSAGVKDFTTVGDSVWLKTNVLTANSLLDTTFKTYSEDSTGATKLRTTSYSVPEGIAPHVDVIAPTTYFGKTRAHRSIRTTKVSTVEEQALEERQVSGPLPAVCNTTITTASGRRYRAFDPDCLRIQYNINNYTPKKSSGSKIAFGSFLNQSAGFADFVQYQKTFNIPVQNFSVVLVNPQDGATDLPQPPDPANVGEANLDVQNIVSLTHPLPITEYITAGSPPYIPDPVEPVGTPNENEPYLQYYEFLLAQRNSDLPQVISNSYGDEEQTVPENYAVRVCNLIGILGLRGISVLESSGDLGVGASCLSPDGKKPQFNPVFPATCPYITSVGGTVSFQPEVAWEGSSGGFSFFFKRPWYQELAVSSYLNKYVSASTKAYYSKYVNFKGRGFPDVSAHSVAPDYTVVYSGALAPSGGTSAAAPVTASVIALLNDARLRAGKPALGFLNPLIYAFGFLGFTDITSGQAIGCNGNDTQTGGPVPGAGVIPGAFWNATKGWDPVTGFGVPNFGKLLTLLGRIP